MTISTMFKFVLLAVGLVSMSWAHPQFSKNKKALCVSMAPFHGADAQPKETFREHYVLSGAGAGRSAFSGEW